MPCGFNASPAQSRCGLPASRKGYGDDLPDELPEIADTHDLKSKAGASSAVL
jgi:hypothetical protein